MGLFSRLITRLSFGKVIKEVGVCPIEHLSNAPTKEEDTEEKKEKIFGQNRILNKGTTRNYELGNSSKVGDFRLEFPWLLSYPPCRTLLCPSFSLKLDEISDMHEMSEVNDINEADEMHDMNDMMTIC